ncbi:LmbE family N-acetylglucosaminyl deacetylase/SAM-dependent methyltransferase [Microbacterium proteolyticum]|uniref:LmbE family N-acetylglucosaminyl deacetylase/SAM-dependent methyltransferase n=1 Tax=Microbacterium proteolyticum TaxID=1572644 RepID=A0A7W5GFV5_9MICO|nr:bifunctional PIG-L family deacetylase/class I SAM-dependent methyltransferase [Microbacterium proteolyticum]MBB3157943.1 LmbE family N-acetylglucosaminyl deacetylase/SAM-dependent methyltransferase [Microbacterium proteolyticum]
MVSFDHRDPGTDEGVWTAALRRDLPALDFDIDRLIVVAAHPDDETLGAAGILATAAVRGIRVELIVVTDGERSHPASPTHSPATLALLRRRELRSAVETLGLSAEPLFLGLPDGGTDEYRDAIATALGDALDRAGSDRVLVLSPWIGDGHRDHRVVGEIVEEVCGARGVRSRAFPIWLWHWGGPDDVPWDAAERLVLDAEIRDAKTRALDVHASQLQPLSPAPGDEPMVHALMRAHFERDAEVFFAPAPAPAPESTVGQAYFDDIYARHDDPWGFDSRWYEERKRAVLLAALPRRRYRATFEAGCSTGALTVELAGRSDRVLAVDLAAAALDRARRRMPDDANVELRRGTLPDDWPAGEFDLVVLSEVAYYWAGADLDRGLTAAVASLSADGHLVACHWRHPVAEYPRTGDSVHDALAERADLVRLVRHEEEDFVLEVFARPGARSVATEAGLAP